MKQPHLPALSLLKLSAVAGIILCHTALLPRFDACTRMVEILFILSGFLMAYNHYIPKNNKEHAKSHTSSEELSPPVFHFACPACGLYFGSSPWFIQHHRKKPHYRIFLHPDIRDFYAPLVHTPQTSR